MENWVNFLSEHFNVYVAAFKGLTSEQVKNFQIKKAHSIRVAELALKLAGELQLSVEKQKLVFACALFHDIGRFRQLIEFNTFNDAKSLDHANFSVEILKEEGFLDGLGTDEKKLVFLAIQNHNKFKIPEKLSEEEKFYCNLLRDADKLDILKVLTDYYTRKKNPNHTLTWELPKGNSVTPKVSKEILAGSLVSKENVVSEIDVKIMQMSWVYDLNFRISFVQLQEKRFLETIYSTLPKNDSVIGIYRKVKVFTENKILSK